MRARNRRAARLDLFRSEQQRRHGERHEVVHGTVDEHRPEQRAGRHLRDRENDHCLEHGDAAWHVTDDSHRHGSGVGAEEREVGDVRFVR